jgi:hypothetical protein
MLFVGPKTTRWKQRDNNEMEGCAASLERGMRITGARSSKRREAKVYKKPVVQKKNKKAAASAGSSRCPHVAIDIDGPDGDETPGGGDERSPAAVVSDVPA